ncbi:hypothetical protein KJ742_02640 [Patescibacteria group bacterium]|nr:hypothetical protein [Patescibacteria group bacterium]MBU1682819.1 hypothetical protein [Patescibacteria group bacterium]MBU1934779.1 hypothetical protein [Patescibacteria group bacterium]
MKKSDIINITISITLILSIGLTAGYAAGYFQAMRNSFPEIEFVDEINQGVTTIKLLDVENGNLIGKISGRNARLAYSADNILELDAESEFEIPLNQIDLEDFYVAETIPEDTLYIASSKGKYYYSIFDKRAFNITPDNRLYFTSTEDAEQKGYQQPK